MFPEINWIAVASITITIGMGWLIVRTNRPRSNPKSSRLIVEEVRRDQVSFSDRAEKTMRNITGRMKMQLRKRGVSEADLEVLIVQTLVIKGDRLLVTFSVQPPHHRFVPDETYAVMGGQWSDLRDSYTDPNQWLGDTPPDRKGWGDPDSWNTSGWGNPNPWKLQDSGGLLDPDGEDEE